MPDCGNIYLSLTGQDQGSINKIGLVSNDRIILWEPVKYH